MSKDGTPAGTVLLAFALGAVAGAAVALLYAPASGEETRRRLAEKTREGADRARALARQGRDFVERHRGTISDAVDRGREVFEQVSQVTKEPL